MRKTLLLFLSIMLFASGLFAQGRYPFGLLPSSGSLSDASSAYSTWKNNYVEACSNGRYRVRFDDRSQSVSEGIAYGMLLAVYANDRTVFDGLWLYYKSFRNGNGVMHWKIGGCTSVLAQNGASDAEVDAAMALIVAHERWGNNGSIKYGDDARALIAVIKRHEIESGSYVMKPGDMFGGSNITNPSYYAPGYFRVYGQFTNDQSFWNSAAARCYTVINNNLSKNNAAGGLVSDWCRADGSYSSDASGYFSGGTRYHYDAARTPWRIAVDYVWFGTADARAYSKKTSDFVRVNLGGSRNVKDGYYQDGRAYGTYHNSTFTGAFACAAMAGENQNHLNDSYTDLKGINDANSYYNQTLKTLYLYTLSGNFYNPLSGGTQPAPEPEPEPTPNPPTTSRGPYNGTAWPVPGTIEAENFDIGGNNVAYFDNNAANEGGAFRNEAVDIESTSDAGGGHNVGWIETGEWLEYTVNVIRTGKYDFNFRVASINSTGSMRISFDGSSVINSVSVPNTSGWQTWQTVTVRGVDLTAGTKVMRIAMTGGGFNLNNVNIAAASSTPAPAPNVPPVVSITSPSSGASFTAGSNITITANASDSDGQVAKVEFYQGNTLISQRTSSPWSITWNNVAAGNYTLTARATDNSGAVTTSSSVNITVTAPAPVSNVAPVVSITSHSSGENIAAGSNITLTADASDSDGHIVLVEFFHGNTLIGSRTSNPWRVKWNNVPAGSYALTAIATDNGGAVTTSSVVNITVGNTTPAPNVAPVVTITSPSSGTSFTAGSNITVTANASDSDGQVAKVEFYQGNALIGQRTSSPWSVTWNNVAAGSYSLTARATDNSGAVTTSSAISINVSQSSSEPAPQPAPGCITNAVPVAAEWAVRNDWNDQSNGAAVSNENSALKFTHRQWGRNHVWLIETGRTLRVEAGRQYTVSFEFGDDASLPVSSLEFGLASGVEWNAPRLISEPVVLTGTSSPGSYVKREVTFTAKNTGNFHIAIKMNWASQVNVQVMNYIRNLSVCGSSSYSKMAENVTSVSSSFEKTLGINFYPNPFNDVLNLELKRESEVKVSDIAGKVVYGPVKLDGLTILNLDYLNTGTYILQIREGEDLKNYKIVKH